MTTTDIAEALEWGRKFNGAAIRLRPLGDILVSFRVEGTPQPRGSKVAQPIYRNGRPVMNAGRVITATRDDNPMSRGWMEQVAAAAAQAMRAAGRTEVYRGPVELHCRFFFPRPKGHFGKKGLRASAPAYPTGRPDSTKLVRGTEDALKNVVWKDDSQVVRLIAEKHYGGTAGAEITVRAMQ